jgi:hypothetical protein
LGTFSAAEKATENSFSSATEVEFNASDDDETAMQ